MHCEPGSSRHDVAIARRPMDAASPRRRRRPRPSGGERLRHRGEMNQVRSARCAYAVRGHVVCDSVSASVPSPSPSRRHRARPRGPGGRSRGLRGTRPRSRPPHRPRGPRSDRRGGGLLAARVARPRSARACPSASRTRSASARLFCTRKAAPVSTRVRAALDAVDAAPTVGSANRVPSVGCSTRKASRSPPPRIEYMPSSSVIAPPTPIAQRSPSPVTCITAVSRAPGMGRPYGPTRRPYVGPFEDSIGARRMGRPARARARRPRSGAT